MCDGMDCNCGDCGDCGNCDCGECSSCCPTVSCTPCAKAIEGCCTAIGELLSGCCRGLEYIFCGCCDEPEIRTGRSRHESRGGDLPSSLHVPMVIVTDPYIGGTSYQPANTNAVAGQQETDEQRRRAIELRYGIKSQQPAIFQAAAGTTRTDAFFPPR